MCYRETNMFIKPRGRRRNKLLKGKFIFRIWLVVMIVQKSVG